MVPSHSQPHVYLYTSCQHIIADGLILVFGVFFLRVEDEIRNARVMEKICKSGSVDCAEVFGCGRYIKKEVGKV